MSRKNKATTTQKRKGPIGPRYRKLAVSEKNRTNSSNYSRDSDCSSQNAVNSGLEIVAVTLCTASDW